MKRATALALLLATSGCFKVIHDHDCDGGIIPPIIPPPAHAQLLFVINLQRSGANLIGPLSVTLTRLQGELAASDVIVDQFAVLPLYGGVDNTPRLVYGYPSPVNSGDPTSALIAATQSGNYDAPLPAVTAEQFNLTLAKRFDTATLPPEQTDGSGTPFFGTPLDEFIIVTVQPTRRLCALDDPACAIDGLAPLDYFTATDEQGAAWLKLAGGSYPPKRIYQVFLTTGEEESPSSFATRCGKIPGFPVALLDVMAPSPTKYYAPLTAGLNQKGWHAEQIDLCAAFGAAQPAIFQGLGRRIGVAAHQ